MINLQRFAEETISNQRTSSLRKAIKSYQKIIEVHETKIKRPETFYVKWNEFNELEKRGFIKHWQKEIKTAKESMQRRITELKKRGEYDERTVDE